MDAGEILLDHLDRMAQSEPRFVRISKEGVKPAISLAIYRDFPVPGAQTGCTIGLSHYHPPDGTHKELTISMIGFDDSWALACGRIAAKLCKDCPFQCGERIGFGPISRGANMAAFVAVHPQWLSAEQAIINLGERQVEITQLIPIYKSEQHWLADQGDLQTLLAAYPKEELMNPRRKPFVSDGESTVDKISNRFAQFFALFKHRFKSS